MANQVSRLPDQQYPKGCLGSNTLWFLPLSWNSQRRRVIITKQTQQQVFEQ